MKAVGMEDAKSIRSVTAKAATSVANLSSAVANYALHSKSASLY